MRTVDLGALENACRQATMITGVDGSRTHQGRLYGTPQTVLKTAEPTGTQPPPTER